MLVTCNYMVSSSNLCLVLLGHLFGYKLLVNLVLILCTPALNDLFKTYDQYKKEWEAKYDMNQTSKLNA